jgi:holo-[acyl-carrier protein] synthase
MKVVIGLDVQSIDDVAKSLEEFGSRYTDKLFTDYEVTSCGGTHPATAASFAARFAAKEAVLKVLDTRRLVPSWRSIEVRREKNGPPRIALSGEAAEMARRQGVRHLSLSLSHDAGVASAAVVAQISRLRRRGHGE